MTLPGGFARIRLIAAMPLHKRRAEASLRSLWVMLGIALLLPTPFFVGGFWDHTGLILGGVLLFVVCGMLTLGWWALFILSAIEQAARPTSPLVPGYGRSLALAIWTVALALSAAYGLAIGLWVHWFIVPGSIVFVLLVLVAAVFSGHWINIAAVVGLALATLRHPGAWMADAFTATTPAARADGVMVLAGSLFLAAWTLASMAPLASLRRFGDWAAAGDTKREATPAPEAAEAPEAVETAKPARVATAATRLFAYAWWQTGRLPPEQADPVARALSVLPLDTEWRFVLYRKARTWLVLLAILAIASRTSLALHADEVFLLGCALVALGLAGHSGTAWIGLDATRREQHLLTLMPGWPQRAAAARTLAWRLSAAYGARLAVDIAGLAALAVIRASAGGEPQWWASAGGLAAVALSCLPHVGRFWQDWSRAVAPIKALRGAVVITLWALNVGAWRAGWVTMPVLVAVQVSATAFYCAYRWRRMADEPAPLPVGRSA